MAVNLTHRYTLAAAGHSLIQVALPAFTAVGGGGKKSK